MPQVILLHYRPWWHASRLRAECHAHMPSDFISSSNQRSLRRSKHPLVCINPAAVHLAFGSVRAAANNHTATFAKRRKRSTTSPTPPLAGIPQSVPTYWYQAAGLPAHAGPASAAPSEASHPRELRPGLAAPRGGPGRAGRQGAPSAPCRLRTKPWCWPATPVAGYTRSTRRSRPRRCSPSATRRCCPSRCTCWKPGASATSCWCGACVLLSPF